MREAGEQGRSIVPVGSGGALALGNPAPVDSIGLSTRALNQVIDYQSTDMTLSVGAGITLAEVQAVIGANGQALPIEAVDPEQATIGGLLATALSGPRRYGGGTLRDVLIGIAIAYADGTVGKAGGLVVKNVSGFDMMRLHYGALGTLGVIVSANFKVLPTIRNEFTAEWTFESLRDAQQTADALRNPLIRPTALTVSQELGGWVVRSRFEGRPGGLNAVSARIGDRLGLPPDSTTNSRQLPGRDSWGDGRLPIRLRSESGSGAGPQTRLRLQSSFELARTCSVLRLLAVNWNPELGLVTASWVFRRFD